MDIQSGTCTKSPLRMGAVRSFFQTKWQLLLNHFCLMTQTWQCKHIERHSHKEELFTPLVWNLPWNQRDGSFSLLNTYKASGTPPFRPNLPAVLNGVERMDFRQTFIPRFVLRMTGIIQRKRWNSKRKRREKWKDPAKVGKATWIRQRIHPTKEVNLFCF